MKKHKNSQTTHPPDPPEPRSVVNNQSSIINRRVPYSPDPLMPLCPLISCPRLLSRPFCRLCSCPLSLVFFHPLFLPALLVPLCSSPLRAFVAISQLCKTNPISKTAKPPQPLMPQRLTPSFRSPPPPKNKPNQTQFITAKPLGEAGTNPIPPQNPGSARPRAKSKGQTNPTCPGEAGTNPILCPRTIKYPASRIEHLAHLTKESWPDYAKQTQCITAKPAWGGPKPDPGPLLRSPRYASRFTRHDPFRFTLAVSAAGRR